MNKAELRVQLREQRDERRHAADATTWVTLAEEAAHAVLAGRNLRPGETIASFSSYGSEPPTTELNARMERLGIRVLLPVISRDGTPFEELAWVDSRDADAMASGRIPNPGGAIIGVGAQGLIDLKCSLLVIPALAAGTDGSRLGQGRGYYDRLLTSLNDKPNPPARVALVFRNEVFDSVPTEEHDQRVDAIAAIG